MDELLSEIINGNDDNSNACMLNPITTHMHVMNILAKTKEQKISAPLGYFWFVRLRLELEISKY